MSKAECPKSQKPVEFRRRENGQYTVYNIENLKKKFGAISGNGSKNEKPGILADIIVKNVEKFRKPQFQKTFIADSQVNPNEWIIG